MKRWLGYFALGLSAYLLFLVARIPAPFVWSQVEPALTQQVPKLQVEGISGRLWQGEAASLSYSGRPLGRLGWQVSPLSLLTGTVAAPLSLQLPQGYLQGEVEVPFGLSSLSVEALKGQAPLQALQALFPYYPVTVGGTLTLDIDTVQLDAGGRIQSLQGEINWVGAEVIAPQAMALGDLQAQLEADKNGVVTARLNDRGGPLSLDATFTLQPQGRYSLNGTVAAASGADAGLTQALGWLGKPDRQGRYQLKWQGQL